MQRESLLHVTDACRPVSHAVHDSHNHNGKDDDGEDDYLGRFQLLNQEFL